MVIKFILIFCGSDVSEDNIECESFTAIYTDSFSPYQYKFLSVNIFRQLYF